MVRTVAIATLVCLASWLGLAVGAGNVGLQRTISAGPLALLESPLAVVLSTALAFAVTVALRGSERDTRTSAWALVGAVLIGDAIGAVVLAPALIGELEIGHAPVVFVVLATLGLQPLAVGAGWFVRRRSVIA
jgi:hypothetical protein